MQFNLDSLWFPFKCLENVVFKFNNLWGMPKFWSLQLVCVLYKYCFMCWLLCITMMYIQLYVYFYAYVKWRATMGDGYSKQFVANPNHLNFLLWPFSIQAGVRHVCPLGLYESCDSWMIWGVNARLCKGGMWRSSNHRFLVNFLCYFFKGKPFPTSFIVRSLLSNFMIMCDSKLL